MSISNFMNRPASQPFHSSGYAQVAHGNHIGSTNPQSFQQRNNIEGNRQAVRGYRDALVVHERSNYTPQRTPVSRTGSSQRVAPTRQEVNAGPKCARKPTSFIHGTTGARIQSLLLARLFFSLSLCYNDVVFGECSSFG